MTIVNNFFLTILGIFGPPPPACPHIQEGLFLCNSSLHDFVLTELENLNHFSNLHKNVQFTVIWHR